MPWQDFDKFSDVSASDIARAIRSRSAFSAYLSKNLVSFTIAAIRPTEAASSERLWDRDAALYQFLRLQRSCIGPWPLGAGLPRQRQRISRA
jgi:hypothetical protein